MKKILTILALMVATVTAYGYTNVLTPGYQPAGATFSNTVSIDWTTQKLVASIDVTNSTGSNELLLSVGQNISDYNNSTGARFHLYLEVGSSSTTMTLCYSDGVGYSNLQDKKTITAKELLIEISKEKGFTINGESWNSATSDFATAYSTLFNLSSIEVGSLEGSSRGKDYDRSHATYNYVRVQGLDEDITSNTPTITVGSLPGTTALNNSDGWNAGGNSFTKTVTIDWNKQKLVASIDLTTCDGTSENILSVGQSISSWATSNARIHLYYTRSGTKLNFWYQDENGSNRMCAQDYVFSGDVFNIEISKANGLMVNGTNLNINNIDLSKLWTITSLEVGSQEGNTRSKATYNYVRVVDINECNDVTLAETTTDTDYATLATTYKDKTQASLTLTRTLTADAWNTFCVPFNITDISAFGTVKEFSSVSGSTMIFKDASTIEAGKPYLVKPAGSNIKNPKFVYATITSDTPETNVSNNSTYNFVGVYGQHTFTSDDASTSYILVSGGSLVNPTANTTMNGMRAYFTYTKSGSVAPRVLIDGVETALTEVVGSEEVSDGRIYNLRGMYVGNDESRLAKGIYIKNGKKVVLN